jgi:MFS family permease
MSRPLDLGGLEIVIAALALVAGTVVFCITLAVAARVVDRLWDRLTPDDEGRDRADRSRGDTARVGRRPAAGVPRTILAAILVAAMLSALGWFTFMVGRARDLA